MGFGHLGVAGPPPKAQNPFFLLFFGPFGGCGTTPFNMGWFDHPQTGYGGGRFSSFLKKKKKKINGQNDVVLGWVGIVVLEPKTV
jgi:hypothetical protein